MRLQPAVGMHLPREVPNEGCSIRYIQTLVNVCALLSNAFWQWTLLSRP